MADVTIPSWREKNLIRARGAVNHSVAGVLALATMGQGVWIGAMLSDHLLVMAQVMGLGAALGGLVYYIWMNRLKLHHRVDMNIMMLTLGGLGMMLGGVIDQGLGMGHGAHQTPKHAMVHSEDHKATQHEAHSGHDHMVHHDDDHSAHDHKSPHHCDHSRDDRMTQGQRDVDQSQHAGHGQHHHGDMSLWAYMLNHGVSFHVLMMLVFSVPPVILFTRCGVRAAAHWGEWVRVHVLGNLFMVLGMIVVGWGAMKLAGQMNVNLGGWQLMWDHMWMLGGMFVGMNLGMLLGRLLVGKKQRERLNMIGV